MIRCPDLTCGHENMDGASVCEVCGAELPTGEAQPPAGGQIECPNCHKMNDADYNFCEFCSTPLKGGAPPTAPPEAEEPAVQLLAEPEPAEEAVPTAPEAAAGLAPGNAKLVVEQGMTVGKQFVLNDPEMLVGREDEEEGIFPDIDLSDQDEGYVHRRHATLKFEDEGLTVTHLGGANKTYVNNQPIPDNTPQGLKIGDKLRFGKVVVRLLGV